MEVPVTPTGMGINIFAEVLNLRESHSLTSGCSVLQVEICTIRAADELVKYNEKLLGDIINYSDSHKTAIKLPASEVTRS